MSYTEAWLAGPKDTRFYTRTYRPADGGVPTAVVVFVHGFIEHIARYEHVFSAWSQRRIAIFAYDQRGFGRTALDHDKSPGSVYGKTCWDDQLVDLDWALAHVQREFAGVPPFLYGHSMGGAVVIGFVTRKASPPDRSSVAALKGVIATSPLLRQSHPVPALVRLAGTGFSHVLPWKTLRAPVNAKHLSHDQAVNDAYERDPLVKPFGTLKGLSDMLDKGEWLLRTDYVSWPEKLPMLLIHGSDDEITSHAATKQFSEYARVNDKTFSSYPNGFHELHNEPDGVKERLIEECIGWVEKRVSQAKL